MEYNKIKVALYCATVHGGGATVAVLNQYRNLSKILDSRIISFREYNFSNRLIFSLNRIFDFCVHKLFFRSNPIFHSSNIVSGVAPLSLEDFDADCVFIHWVSNGAISKKILKQMRGKKILVLHDSWWSCGFEHHPKLGVRSMSGFDKILLSRKTAALAEIDFVIAPSMWQLKSFLSVHPEFEPSSRVIRNFYPNVIARNFNDAPFLKICFVGHNLLSDFHKGARSLRKLLDLIHREKFSCQIYIIGRVKERVRKEFSTYAFVNFCGPLSNDDVLDMFHDIDVFCNFSELENFSYVNIEAQLCGAFLFAWDVGGNCETIADEACGAIFPLNDCEIVFQRMEKISQGLDSFRSSRYKRAAFARHTFDNRIVLRQHLELIDEILS